MWFLANYDKKIFNYIIKKNIQVIDQFNKIFNIGILKVKKKP